MINKLENDIELTIDRYIHLITDDYGEVNYNRIEIIYDGSGFHGIIIDNDLENIRI